MPMPNVSYRYRRTKVQLTHQRAACLSHPGGGGGGVLIIFLSGGVPPGPENPYPISDQNIRFSIPYFRPDSQNVYPILDPVI